MAASNLGGETASLSRGIKEIVVGLFPSWPTLVTTLITLFLCVLLLHFFFKKPIRATIDRRREAIAVRIEKAKQDQNKASEILNKQRSLIRESHIEARQIIEDAKLQAQKIGEEYVKHAYQRAEEIKRQARLEVERERKEFEIAARKHIIDSAISLAKTILEREVREEDNERLFTSVLKEEGE